eukprot:TRINITY_DN5088_c0_g1_i17.p2 TRINITY_DN5088_c0_g1~~TRINITY_DN5088_c0_g1_i17.p2  ORF type:complete len:159 (+),score=19.13 TRINITY_DN5088_c0_g1_i17:768-1244(+)
MRYASLATHLGHEQSRRDDLEGLGFSLIYLMKGKLPWQGIEVNNKQERYDKIKQYKMDLDFYVICEGLPEEMLKYMQYCRNLKFNEKPDYQSLRNAFRNHSEHFSKKQNHLKQMGMKSFFQGKKLNLKSQLNRSLSDLSDETHKSSAKPLNFVHSPHP